MNTLHTLALFCLCLFVMVIPVDDLLAPGGVSLVKLTGLLSFAATALLLVSGMPLRGSGGFMFICLLYICWVIASFLWTTMPADYQHAQAINSRQSVKANLYVLGVVLLMFQLVRSERDLRAVMVAFLLGCSWLIALFLRDYEPGVTTVRHGLVGLDANEMTVIISIAIPLAVYLMLRGQMLVWRLAGLLYLPVAMLAVLATGSRTGLVVMLVAALSLLPLLLKANLLIRLLSIAVVVSGLLWALSVLPDKTLERLLSTRSELSSGTLSERSITWEKAWLEFQQQPLFGQGLGSFRQLMNKHHVEYTAHNSYISIAVEQGVIGLLFYLAMILTVFRQCLSRCAGQRWLLIPLLMIVVLGQMTLTLHEMMYVWLVYMLVMLAALLNDEAAYTQEAA